MGVVPDEDGGNEACANCGKHGSDAVKLKHCTACRLVRYCGVDCQKAHRKQHKKACKKREGELKGGSSGSLSIGMRGGSVPPPVSSFPVRVIMKICGACERELPEDSYSEEQRGLRQSSQRCEECVAAKNELVLMKKGSTRSEEDDCPICQLPLPLDASRFMYKSCCTKTV